MQLIIPMLLLGLTYNLLQAVQNFFQGTFSFEILIKSLFGIIVGYQPALSGLWFVYTLILTKVISNILSEKLKPIIAIGFLLISIYLNEYTEAIYHNCFANILLAYPLYYLGEFISKYKNRINGLSNKIILCCITITGAIGVIISGLNNETVWMYMGQYGTNMFYFLLGGISGTIMVYGICKLFLDFKNKYILILAEGSILILAFQNIFISITYTLTGGYGYYIMSLLLLVGFIPIIVLCQKFFPILLGYRNSMAIPAAENHGGGGVNP